jgi:hypothetical protein
LYKKSHSILAKLILFICLKNNRKISIIIHKKKRRKSETKISLLTACAILYQPSGFSGGYTETQPGGNVWQFVL